MACVSNRIDFIQDGLFFELNTDLRRLFGDRFFDSGRSCQFASTAEFERFAELDTKMGLLLGDCYCRRNEYDTRMMVWIEYHIRRNAHYQMDMSWPLIELGKITREGARRGALSGVDILIKHGYTPKWLDEFK